MIKYYLESVTGSQISVHSIWGEKKTSIWIGRKIVTIDNGMLSIRIDDLKEKGLLKEISKEEFQGYYDKAIEIIKENL